MFISTLLIDDPNVADEASLPTFMFLPQPNDGGVTPGLYNLSFEFDKRITENFGFSLSDGYQWLRTPGASMASGWQNLEGALKYKAASTRSMSSCSHSGCRESCAYRRDRQHRCRARQ